jgi:hypothetical protein
MRTLIISLVAGLVLAHWRAYERLGWIGAIAVPLAAAIWLAAGCVAGWCR